MVKVTSPLGSSEARGKIGGRVYNTWRGISYVRRKVTPGNQNTPRRLAIRAFAKACTTQWQTISDVLRRQWDYFASTHPDPDWTGNPCRKSGYNWFIRTNVRLLDMGLSILDAPPYRANAWPLATLAATNSADTIVVTWTLPPGAPDTTLTADIWISRAMSAGRKPTLDQAKHSAYVASESGTHTITTLGHGHYGIFARTIDEATGLASPWLLATADVTEGLPEHQGPSFPTAYADLHTGVTDWVDPQKLYAQDGQNGETDSDAGEESDRCIFRAYGFTIPLTATLTGIIATVESYEFDSQTVHAQLAYLGALIGTVKDIIDTANGHHILTFGSSSDLWGATLTPAIINDPTFGLSLSATPVILMGAPWISDYCKLTAHYTT